MSHVMPIDYTYGGKHKHFDLVRCDRQITTICEVYEVEGQDEFEIDVISEGMDYAEIVANFPPDRNGIRAGKEYCLVDIIRAVIYEAYQEEGSSLEEGNVRNLWYTHLKFLVEEILGLGETPSVKGAINHAWQDLIVSGIVTYEGMNIVSAKENVRKSFVRDSPFSNLIIAVEKENLFDHFKWLPELFNSTLITAGGQPSRAVSRSFIKELMDNGVDLDQTFYMCVVSDLDPAGYYIQEAFRKQLEKSIEYYGGSGKVKIRRLFVKADQVSPNLLKHQAMPCEDKGAKSVSAKKAEDTKWAWFCEQTKTPANPQGGLYKDEGNGPYRAKLELNSFPNNIIERKIIEELLKIIHATSDESLIMIPEIMRIFEHMKKEVRDEIFERNRESWLVPIIKEFLKKAEELAAGLTGLTAKEERKENERYAEEIAPIEETYEDQREEACDAYQEVETEQSEIIDEYTLDNFPGEFEGTRLDEIEAELRMLYREQELIESIRNEDCEEQYDAIREAEQERDATIEYINEEEEAEIAPHLEEHEEHMEEIGWRGKYRQEKVEEYRRWKEAEFNPVEQELRSNIEEAMQIPELDKRYVDLEDDGRTQPHIAKMMTEPDTLLVDEVSAWEQEEVPVFTEDDLLVKASKAHHKNVEPVRRGFTTDFTGGMKNIIHEHADKVEFEYPEVTELDDIEEEIKKLALQIADGIVNGDHKKDEDDDEEVGA